MHNPLILIGSLTSGSMISSYYYGQVVNDSTNDITVVLEVSFQIKIHSERRVSSGIIPL